MDHVLESENARLTAEARRLRRDLARVRNELDVVRATALEIFDYAEEHTPAGSNAAYLAKLSRRIWPKEREGAGDGWVHL